MWTQFEHEGEWYSVSCYTELYSYDEGYDQNSGGDIPVYQMSRETYNEVEIGSYYSFKSDGLVFPFKHLS